MRTLLSIAVLMSVALPAAAAPSLPEPETLGLLAIAAIAMLVVRRIKK